MRKILVSVIVPGALVLASGCGSSATQPASQQSQETQPAPAATPHAQTPAPSYSPTPYASNNGGVYNYPQGYWNFPYPNGGGSRVPSTSVTCTPPAGSTVCTAQPAGATTTASGTGVAAPSGSGVAAPVVGGGGLPSIGRTIGSTTAIYFNGTSFLSYTVPEGSMVYQVTDSVAAYTLTVGSAYTDLAGARQTVTVGRAGGNGSNFAVSFQGAPEIIGNQIDDDANGVVQ